MAKSTDETRLRRLQNAQRRAERAWTALHEARAELRQAASRVTAGQLFEAEIDGRGHDTHTPEGREAAAIDWFDNAGA